MRITTTIKGIAPLIMHNGLLADPEYDWSRRIKEVTSQRKKTDEDRAHLSRLEFMGSLYQQNGRVVVPGAMLMGMLIEGAKKSKLGKVVKAGAIVLDTCVPLDYDGPENLDALYADPRFVSRVGVKVQSARVIRVRPIFPEWSLTFSTEVVEDIMNPSDFQQCLENAGRLCGIGDWRPQHGRFELEAFEH